jgi:hypothetical protein
MKTFVFLFKVVPMKDSTYYLTVKYAAATVWALAETVSEADVICRNHLKEYGWVITQVEKDGRETIPEHYHDRPDGLLLFLKAQRHGVAAHFVMDGHGPLSSSDNSKN